jgi:hypothetical protein
MHSVHFVASFECDKGSYPQHQGAAKVDWCELGKWTELSDCSSRIEWPHISSAMNGIPLKGQHICSVGGIHCPIYETNVFLKVWRIS